MGSPQRNPRLFRDALPAGGRVVALRQAAGWQPPILLICPLGEGVHLLQDVSGLGLKTFLAPMSCGSRSAVTGIVGLLAVTVAVTATPLGEACDPPLPMGHGPTYPPG